MKTRVLVVDDSATLRRVVSQILDRHGFEALVAADGLQALDVLRNESIPVDLVLVDFVMPRMNGFQFCRALREEPRLSHLPVVLMSAKSDRIRDQFVLQTGAMDALSKPFDAQALVAVLQHAIDRIRSGRRSIPHRFPGDPRGLPPPKPESMVPEGAPFGPTGPTLPHLARGVHPVLASLYDRSSDDVKRALESRLGSEGLHRLAMALESPEGAREDRMLLSGHLEALPIGAVLQMLQLEQKSGVLAAHDGRTEVTVVLSEGRIDFVESRNAGEEFRLGRFFVEQGLLSPDDLEAVLTEQKSSASRSGPIPPEAAMATDPSEGGAQAPATVPPPSANPPLLGDALVQRGFVTSEQLREALSRQASELIYEILRWESGTFEFRRAPMPPRATRVQLQLPIAHVIMEGVRRVDEWRVVEAQIESFEAVLQPDPVAIHALESDTLSRPERLVLQLVNGERTVREVIAQSHMSSFDACKILYQLLEARLIRRKGA